MTMILLEDSAGSVAANSDVLFNVGFYLALVLPILLVLLIARFRGFWASLFFLPFFGGVVAFVLSFAEVTDALNAVENFGPGLLSGLAAVETYFRAFHTHMMELICNAANNEIVSDVLLADWFCFVPYLVLFVFCFALFKKKKVRKEEDYF